jgi:hypothetical protein
VNGVASDDAFDALVDVIADELFARIAVRDRLETAEDARRVAALIADGVATRFELRDRATSLGA